MDNLICTDCGTTFYSAAARLMVERGERCDCGGLLQVRDEDRPLVGVAGGGPHGAPPRTGYGRRRFAR